MLISPSAVEAFLNRALRDCHKYKNYSTAKLDRLLAKHDVRFHTAPRKHQKVCFLLGLKYNAFLYSLDMGLGKTWLALNLFNHHRRKNGNRFRMLVLVPGRSHPNEWKDQCRQHTPDLKLSAVDGHGDAQRLKQMQAGDISVITYAGFLKLVTTPVPTKTKGKKTRNKWAIDPWKLKKLARKFHIATPDECQALGNPNATTFKAYHAFADELKRKYELSGTPFGNDPMELWSIFKALDGGETLGTTLGLFRAAFCTASRSRWHRGYDYTFDRRKKKILSKMIRNRSIRYETSECEDLPKQVFVPVPVEFDPETYQYYDKLVERIIESKEGAKPIQSSYIRLRQLTAGYMTYKVQKETKQSDFKYQPKLDALIDRLKQTPKGRKAVIWHHYIRSGRLISERMKKEGLKFVWLYSGVSNQKAVVERFKSDPSIQFLISSPAGKAGGNWQAANYAHFFESPSNPRDRGQMEKRIHRLGQSNKCFYYDYYVEGSIDQHILHAVEDGTDFFKAVMGDKKSAKKLVRK